MGRWSCTENWTWNSNGGGVGEAGADGVEGVFGELATLGPSGARGEDGVDGVAGAVGVVVEVEGPLGGSGKRDGVVEGGGSGKRISTLGDRVTFESVAGVD